MTPFHSVLIQTNRKCTRQCHHCFYGQYNYSSDDIIEKDTVIGILRELASIEFKGRVSFYGNNEPLTDKRLVDFLREARQTLPETFLFLQTNGDLLNEALRETLLSYLDGLQVNLYDETTLQYPQGKIRVVNKADIPNSSWSNKAGYLKDIGKLPGNACCGNPFRQLYIAPPGLVALCPSDAFLQYPLGDVRKQSLLAIWNGTLFEEIRCKLANSMRSELPLCSKCDSDIGLLMELGKDRWHY